MKEGLLFGSFNPIHKGHLEISSYFLNHSDLKNIRFVVSPENPLKDKNTLLNPIDRAYLVKLALESNQNMECSEVELSMPKPSFTIDTLDFLKKENPRQTFVVIMGTDNLESLGKWKEYNRILEEYQLYVYPRNGYDGGAFISHPNVKLFSSKFLEVSSTELRKKIREGNVNNWLPENVAKLIQEKKFYCEKD